MRTRTLRDTGAAALALILVVTGRPAAAAEPSGHYQGRGNETTARSSQRVRLGADGNVTVNIMHGDIVVTGGSGEDVTVDAVRHGGDAQDDAGTGQPRVESRPGRVDIRLDFTGGRMPRSVDLTITIPASAGLDVRSVSGNIKVSGVKGAVRASTVNGNVSVSGAPQLESASSVSGNVEVADVSTVADVSIGSVSGFVHGRAIKARGLDVKSVSGEIILNDVACSRLSGRTVSGNIDYTGEIAKGGSYDLNSHSGTVHLAIPSGVGFQLNATTFSGSIRSDLPLTIEPDAPTPPTPTGARDDRSDRDRDRDRGRDRGPRRQSVRANYGDASATLTLRSFSGNIVITKR